MIPQHIDDWDAAYANAAYIPGGDRWPQAWATPAAAYRSEMEREKRARLDLAYGPAARNRFDLFLPKSTPKGLVVFVHGGYWMELDKSSWSHLAGGAVDSGWAVAMPSYTLCPDIRISGITAEIGRGVTAAAGIVAGAIRLAGHSAGGHLVTRMVSATSPLAADLQQRITGVISIAGVHDLRPLMRTRMNVTLRLDAAEAVAESPALLEPMEGARVVCWVGAAERSEFLRQSALLTNIWTGLGARTLPVVEPDRHHFNVVDGLADATHPLCRALLAD